MPEIYKLPSIWDQIAGAASTGIESYQDARERLRQQHMQEVGLLTNLFGAGAIDNTDLMPGLQSVGIKANVQPNAPQRQRDILKSPDVNPVTGKPWSYAERKIAGIPSATEEAKDTNELSGEQIKSRFLKGEALTEREAKFAGVPTDEDLTLGKLQKQNAVLSEIGPRYVDMALAQTGGRVPSNWNNVVDKAFAAYVADRQRAGLPADPSHRAFFVSQIFERMVQQRQLDISQQNANANMASATRSQTTAIDRQFAAMTNLVESRRKALDDIASADPTLSFKLQNPKYANDPSVKNFQNAQRAYTNAVNAQAQAASLTPQQAKLLRMDSEPQQQQTAAPKWGATQHNAVAQRILKRQVTWPEVQAYVASGQMTAGDYNAIQDIVAKTQRKK